MVIELTEEQESALKIGANAHGVPPDVYVREALERDLDHTTDARPPLAPLKSSRGILARYGRAPSAEDIAEVRAEMFQNFEERY